MIIVYTIFDRDVSMFKFFREMKQSSENFEMLLNSTKDSIFLTEKPSEDEESNDNLNEEEKNQTKLMYINSSS